MLCLLLCCVQKLAGGKPVRITSPMGELPLWGMEIDPEQVGCNIPHTVPTPSNYSTVGWSNSCLHLHINRIGAFHY